MSERMKRIVILLSMGGGLLAPVATAQVPVKEGLIFWLDASQSSSVQVSGDKVTRWSDLSGNSRYVDQAEATLQPTYVKGALGGKPIVDFGDSVYGSVLKPWMQFRDAAGTALSINTIRTVFWVCGMDSGSNGFLLGSNTNYHFHRGQQNQIWDGANGWASANIRNGSTYLNRVKVDGTQTVLPTDYSIVSVVTTANVEAGALTKDRTYRTGGIKLGELLIYTRALSDEERVSVENYLYNKWFVSGAAAVLDPGMGATDVPRDATLIWTPGKYAASHDVYFGTSFDDVNTASAASPQAVLASAGQTATQFDPTGVFAYGQTYYWRVDEVNAPDKPGLYKGDVWSFTAEPYGYPVTPIKASASSSLASTMGPEKTIDGSGLDALDQHATSASQMWLSKKGQSPIWIQYEFDKVYKLHQMWVWNSNQSIEPSVGFGAKDVTIETSPEGSTWTALAGVPEFAQASGEPNYVHSTTVDFAGAPARFVRLTVSSNWADGAKQAGLAEVRFFYVPVQAFKPAPAHGATGVALNAVLNWRPGREAAKHDVYVSGDANAVIAGTAAPRAVTEHSLGLGSLGLEFGRTYYWKVNEVNDVAATTSWPGDVWSFATIGYAVVDDFESYNDVCSRIFFAWVDGFGHSGSADCGVAPSLGNSTGSTVGNTNPPFAEKSIVHSGSQAMPMWFDNSKSPYYSETIREWPTAQSWMGGGANTLTVWVRGEAAAFLEISPGTLAMNGTGTDIWNTGDQFRLVYKSLKGNGSIVAKVEAVARTNEWAKAGVMIRETVGPGSTHAFVAVTPTPSHGISFQRRPTTDGAGEYTDVANTPVPQWIKVTRTGNSLTAQYSADGKAWTDIVPATPVSITMANDVLIGLAVTSHAADSVCGAKFSSVSTTGGVSGAWQVAEIGVAQVAGNLPETLYVGVQDSAGKTVVVSHADAATIATGNWEQWDIPLSLFTSAGVNVGSVKKMIIGVGQRGAPKVGGAGKLYLDDLRLTRVGP